MPRRSRRAFVFVELLVVLALLALLVPVALSSACRARETANRVKCGSNLRQIGQALMIYAQENKGEYPRTRYQPGVAPTQYTGVFAANPFTAGDAPGPNDVSAAMFLLVRTQDITTEVFVCASGNGEKYSRHDGKDLRESSNFPDEVALSYSVANPYPDGVNVKKRFPQNGISDADYALAADMNPGKDGDFDATAPTATSNAKAMQRANSRNHEAAGQNILFGDGHVEFVQNPFCGIKRDNVYTVAGAADGSAPTSGVISGSPKWDGDSVLLPVATLNPHRFHASNSTSYWVAGGAVVVCAVAAVLIYRVVRARRRLAVPAA
jgi:prepilin-type processing-associated H-X9-DG protein